MEEDAILKAEKECFDDSEQRERKKQRATIKRQELDNHFVKQFVMKIRELFPNCPLGREQIISQHACLKYSGRIGRTKAAKDFSNEAITLAVIAHIRHIETNYDELVGKGYDRYDARNLVESEVNSILSQWK